VVLGNGGVPEEDAEVFAFVSIIDDEERHGASAVAQPVQMVGLDLFSWRQKPNMQGRALRKPLGHLA
jgi:hypothetical protein